MMVELTEKLATIVNQSTKDNVMESIDSAYDLLHETGYDAEFINRHRAIDLEGLRLSASSASPR